MRPGEHRRLREKEISVCGQHSGDASKSVLVKEAVQALHHLLEGQQDLVKDVDGEARVGQGE